LQESNQELEKEIARRKESEAELRHYEEQLEEMVDQRTKELQLALANVKILTGMLPICASCKNIRDDEGYWHQVEVYIRSHTEVEFSHGICPDCTTKLYPELHLKQIN
jgi:HPt (histidine-containing phosphotransfer) domain-containing protein